MRIINISRHSRMEIITLRPHFMRLKLANTKEIKVKFITAYGASEPETKSTTNFLNEFGSGSNCATMWSYFGNM